MEAVQFDERNLEHEAAVTTNNFESLDGLACKLCEKHSNGREGLERHQGCMIQTDLEHDAVGTTAGFESLDGLDCKLCEGHSHSHEGLRRHQGSMIQNLKQDKLGEKHSHKKLHKIPVFYKCQESLDHMAEDDLAEKEMDLEAVQVSMDIFGSPSFEESLDLEPDTTAKLESIECKFCERRFDSSGEMGRHIGCKHKLNIHHENL